MAGIVFFYEPYEVDVWADKRFDAWNYAVKAAGDISAAIIVNKTEEDVQPFDQAMDIEVVSSLEEADLPSSAVYVVPPWYSGAVQNLWESNHDHDWYVFGPASESNWVPDGAKCITVPQQGLGALHSVHIASTVMLHRYWVRRDHHASGRSGRELR